MPRSPFLVDMIYYFPSMLGGSHRGPASTRDGASGRSGHFYRPPGLVRHKARSRFDRKYFQQIYGQQHLERSTAAFRLDGKTSSTIAATCSVPSVHGTDFASRSRARSDKVRSRFSDCDCHSGAFRDATGCSAKVVQKALADFFSFK